MSYEYIGSSLGDLPVEVDPDTNMPSLPPGYRWVTNPVGSLYPDSLRIRLEKKVWWGWKVEAYEWVKPVDDSPRSINRFYTPVEWIQVRAKVLRDKTLTPPTPDLTPYVGIFPPNKLGS